MRGFYGEKTNNCRSSQYDQGEEQIRGLHGPKSRRFKIDERRDKHHYDRQHDNHQNRELGCPSHWGQEYHFPEG